jgi:nucleoside phosphorylase
VVTNLTRTFPSVKWRFLVGIAGGVPGPKHDIGLGDAVVSMPDGTYGGVILYDLGRDTDDGFQLKGFLHPPPAPLKSTVQLMRSEHLVTENKICKFLLEMMTRSSRLSIYQRPSSDFDILFDTNNSHAANQPTCKDCDKRNIVLRSPRHFSETEIHYGLIASGDRIVKDGVKRSNYT